MALNFEKEKLVEELKKRKPRKVLVQLAEGIKRDANEIAGWIEDLGIECIFSGESCWGACSVAVQEAQALGVDLLIHFGHAQFIEVDFPILYIEVQEKIVGKQHSDCYIESYKFEKSIKPSLPGFWIIFLRINYDIVFDFRHAWC